MPIYFHVAANVLSIVGMKGLHDATVAHKDSKDVHHVVNVRHYPAEETTLVSDTMYMMHGTAVVQPNESPKLQLSYCAPFPPSYKQLPASDIVMSATVQIISTPEEVQSDNSFMHFRGCMYEYDVDLKRNVQCNLTFLVEHESAQFSRVIEFLKPGKKIDALFRYRIWVEGLDQAYGRILKLSLLSSETSPVKERSLFKGSATSRKPILGLMEEPATGASGSRHCSLAATAPSDKTGQTGKPSGQRDSYGYPNVIASPAASFQGTMTNQGMIGEQPPSSQPSPTPAPRPAPLEVFEPSSPLAGDQSSQGTEEFSGTDTPQSGSTLPANESAASQQLPRPNRIKKRAPP